MGVALSSGIDLRTALVAATALHAGFQATVTVAVYPSLLRVSDGDWSRAHAAHSRAITPLVVVVYGVALVTCTLAVVRAPAPGTWLAATAIAGVFALTALGAAPTHARLGRTRTPALARRLRVVDRWRLVGALVALVAAIAST